jgi:squalene-associated FAD-dependent desaturase
VELKSKDVAIIGGGFAGLSAGVALARQGLSVAVIEGKPALGGRAYSFIDEETGDSVDNGQHVLMGCYRETLKFLETLGTRNRLAEQRDLEIEMIAGPGACAVVRTMRLPGPLHMSGAILHYHHLGLRERLGVIRAGLQLMYLRRFARERLARMTVAEFMTVSRQDERSRSRFWYPMAIATLNEDPTLASAALLAEVLKRAFFARRRDSAFLYSTVGLSALYCDPARAFIEQRDGVIVCRALVERFGFDQHGTIRRLHLRDGRTLEAANFVAAVTPDRLVRLLPEGAAQDRVLGGIAALKSSPIICVHLWLDREVTGAAFAGFIGTQTQWLFNKRRMFERRDDSRRGYLSFVISGARELMGHPNDAILEIVMADLRAMIPASREARVLKALVLREKQATIAPDPLSDAQRPPVQTPIRNLFLAGDWIQTGLPATIESAVMAGNAAARAVIERARANASARA